MTISFKDAVKRMDGAKDLKLHFFYCEQGADGKPVMLVDTSRIDLKKNKDVTETLATAKVKGHIGGSMVLKGKTLVLTPQGSTLSSTKLEKGVALAAKNASITTLVTDISVGEPEPEEMHEKDKGSEFNGEDQGIGWRNPSQPNDKRMVTEYANDPSSSQGTVDKGLLKNAKGEPVDGKQGFVIDPKTGKVHLFTGGVEIENTLTKERRKADPKNLNLSALKPDERYVSTHHTSPLGGRAVGGAGEIKASDGLIRKISDQSGHYKPEADLTHQSVKSLKDQGARLVDDKLVGMDPDGGERDVTEEEEKEFATLQEYRRKIGLKEGASLGDKLKQLVAEKKRDEELEKMVRLEVKLRKGGVGPARKEAVVVLGGKGLSEEEFASVKGDRVKINKLLESKYGVHDVLDADVDAKVLGTLLELNNHVRKHMDKVKLGAEQFLQTGGGEKAIRQKREVVGDLGESLIDDEEWNDIKGNRDKVNAAIRKRIGVAEFLKKDAKVEDLARVLNSQAVLNALIAKKRGTVPADQLDYGMPEAWNDTQISEEDPIFDKFPGLKYQDEMTYGDAAKTLKMTLPALYEKVTGKKA